VIWRSASLVMMGFLAVFGMGGSGSALLAADGSAGRLTVIDGDTLYGDGALIQLAGVDAPELGQQCLDDGATLYSCGLAAAFELEKIIALEPVTCSPSSAPGSGYECFAPDGPLNRRLVEEGLVVALPDGDLTGAENQARSIPLGIWRGTFVAPRAWRAGTRLPEERTDERLCPVLGIERDGRRLYVVPTDPAYENLSEDGSIVERRFCSDEEARANGYQYAHSAGAAG
jgi:endonuclease YncB( thermonuclease family)